MPACPLEVGGLNITGSMVAEIVPIEKEAQEVLLNGPITPITSVVHEQQTKAIGLAFDGLSTVISGAAGARLATNELGGVFGQ